MEREGFEDARYAVRAWSQTVAWATVLGGLGMVLTGFAERNTAMFAAGFTAIVTAFLPRARPKVVYELARTAAMKRGWTPIPPDEKATIAREIVIGPKGVRPKN